MLTSLNAPAAGGDVVREHLAAGPVGTEVALGGEARKSVLFRHASTHELPASPDHRGAMAVMSMPDGDHRKLSNTGEM
jgi:hypothetical protein